MTTYIYESPDGGKTVQRREFGSPISLDVNGPVSKSLQAMRDNQLWYKIRQAAETNPALKDLLDQAIVVYNLTKSE